MKNTIQSVIWALDDLHVTTLRYTSAEAQDGETHLNGFPPPFTMSLCVFLCVSSSHLCVCCCVPLYIFTTSLCCCCCCCCCCCVPVYIFTTSLCSSVYLHHISLLLLLLCSCVYLHHISLCSSVYLHHISLLLLCSCVYLHHVSLCSSVYLHQVSLCCCCCCCCCCVPVCIFTTSLSVVVVVFLCVSSPRLSVCSSVHEGHREVCGGGHREVPGPSAPVHAAASRHRGAADGWYEGGGGPVWQWEDVPPTGRS